MSLELGIERWAFWSPATTDPRAWRSDAVHAREPLSARDVPGELIPPMHRRRMSALSRMGVQVALQLGPEVTPDYLVFCSRHGEVDRSESLIANIASGTELSPTEFSLSVHNVSGGLYSIITNSIAPSTSLAAGSASFAAAWLEAEAFIHAKPSGRVMLVEQHTTLPEPLRSYVRSDASPYSLALLINRPAPGRSAVSLELQPSSDGCDGCAMGPEFLRWWLGDRSTLTLSAEEQGFTWVRH